MTNRRATPARRRRRPASLALPAAQRSGPRRPKLGAIFDDLVQAQLRRGPEGATQLGLDTGANADLRAKLSDQSLRRARTPPRRRPRAELARAGGDGPRRAVARRAGRPRLRPLHPPHRRSRCSGSTSAARAMAPAPMSCRSRSGAYQSVPDFLDTKHPIETAGDADAYLSRLRAFAGQLDDQTERMRHDAGARRGAARLHPRPRADAAGQDRGRRPAEALVVQIARQARRRKGLAAALCPRRRAAVGRRGAARAATARSPRRATCAAPPRHDAGVWKLPQGGAFYAAALQATTTASLSPEEVHKFGLDQAAAITARLDAELRKPG